MTSSLRAPRREAARCGAFSFGETPFKRRLLLRVFSVDYGRPVVSAVDFGVGVSSLLTGDAVLLRFKSP